MAYDPLPESIIARTERQLRSADRPGYKVNAYGHDTINSPVIITFPVIISEAANLF